MRRAMVESQLRTSGVNDPRLIAAMAAVPREYFVPSERAALAYVDRPVPLGGAREMNAPLVTGLLLTEARVRADDGVLVVGAGSGYAAALLDRLAARVTALESDPALVEKARATLAGSRVTVVEGPLAAGHAAGAPYSLILVDGAVEHLPDALVAQLGADGRIVAAIQERGVARLSIGRRTPSGAFGVAPFADAEAVALPGFAVERGFMF